MPPSKRKRMTSTSKMPYRKRRTTTTRLRYPMSPRGFPGQYARLELSRRGIVEKKVIDTAFVSPVSTTGNTLLLSGVATGTDYTNRIGRRIVLRSLFMRGFISLDPTATAAIPQLGRVIIVQDKNPNSGSTFAVTDLLDTASSTSQLNMSNRDRFNILSDKQYAFGFFSNVATQAIAMGPAIYPYKKYIKLNIPVTFSGTGNTISSIAENAIFVMFIGSVAASANDLQAVMSVRVRFEDA